MKLRPKPSHLQLKLLLADGVPAELPSEKNEELVYALVELLVSAAAEGITTSSNQGGQDESETDQ